MSRTHDVYPNHTDEQAKRCGLCLLEHRLRRVYDGMIDSHAYTSAAQFRDAWGGVPRLLPAQPPADAKGRPTEISEYPEKMTAHGRASYGCPRCHKQKKELFYCRSCRAFVCRKCTAKPVTFDDNRCLFCRPKVKR